MWDQIKRVVEGIQSKRIEEKKLDKFKNKNTRTSSRLPSAIHEIITEILELHAHTQNQAQ